MWAALPYDCSEKSSISQLSPTYFLTNSGKEGMPHRNVFSVEKRNRSGVSKREENLCSRVLIQDPNEPYRTCKIPKGKERLIGTIYVPFALSIVGILLQLCVQTPQVVSYTDLEFAMAIKSPRFRPAGVVELA